MTKLGIFMGLKALIFYVPYVKNPTLLSILKYIDNSIFLSDKRGGYLTIVNIQLYRLIKLTKNLLGFFFILDKVDYTKFVSLANF